MARIDPDAAADERLARIYVAVTLTDAWRAEKVLTARGLDYVVTSEPLGRTLLGSPRNVAVFAVREAHASDGTSVLTAAGFGKGVIRAE